MGFAQEAATAYTLFVQERFLHKKSRLHKKSVCYFTRMGTLRELLEFIVIIGRHWGRLMTGGIIVALAVIYEHLSEKALLGWPLWLAILVALFLSFFLAWRDERRRVSAFESALAEKDAAHKWEVEAAKKELGEEIEKLKQGLEEERAKNARPEIRGTIKQVYFQRLKSESAIDLTRYAIFVEASLTNFRPVTTTVREFRIRLVTDNTEYEAPQTYPEGWGYEPKQKSEYATYALEGWQLQRDPQSAGYEQGRAQEGWLYFTRIIDEIEVENVKKVVLIAVDAFGTRHEVVSEPPWEKLGKIVPYPY